MALLSGVLRVTCPRSGKEVKVNDECVPKGGPRCPFFKYVSLQGQTSFYVKCDYNET